MKRSILFAVPLIFGLSACGGVAYVKDLSSPLLNRGAKSEFAAMPQGDITRIAFGSCADEELPQPIWASIGKAKPDLFLMLGDAIYADRENGGQYVKDPGPVAIAASYDLLNQVSEFKKFQSKVPILVTWDDHDLGKNDAGSEFPYRQESKDLMLDFFGVNKNAAVRSRDGIYSSKVFGSEGQRVQVIMLDTRWFRSRPKKTDAWGKTGKERYLPDADPAKTMLGAAQWAWLEEQLKVPADVRILASSQQVIADGHGWEAWRNFPLEREKLYGLIESTGAEGIVILSGDRHVGGIYENSDVGTYPLIEMTSSALNKSFADTSEEEGPYQVGRLYAPNNFGLVEIDWATRSLEVELRNEEGATVRKIAVPFDTLKPLPKKNPETH